MPDSLIHLAQLLKSFTVFSEMSIEQLQVLAAFSSIKTINKNNVLIEEGQSAKYFYLLIKGSLAVVSRKQLSDKIAYDTAYPGEIIGEMPLFYSETRTASVIARSPSVVIAVPIQRFQELAKSDFLYAQVLTAIARNMAKRLHVSKKNYRKSYKNFHHLNDGMMINITGISIFIFIVPIIKSLHQNFSYHQTINTLVIAFLALGALGAAKYAKVQWKDLGLTIHNWKSAIVESLLFSTLALLVILLLRYFVLRYDPDFKLAAFLQESESYTEASLFIAVAVYTLFSIIQEFIARGCLQGPMTVLLMGKYIDIKAIIISNLLFSSFHVIYSYRLAVVTFIPGLFWGWLYSRNQSLIGVSLSHAILGSLVLFVL